MPRSQPPRDFLAFALKEGPSAERWMQTFIRLMAPDVFHVFLLRRVCRQLRDYVDEEMTNREWELLIACLARDPLLRAYLTGQQLDDDGVFVRRENAKETLEAALREDRREIDPGIWLLLDSLTERAVTSAVSGSRFARAFPNHVRGVSYYALWLASYGNREKGPEREVITHPHPSPSPSAHQPIPHPHPHTLTPSHPHTLTPSHPHALTPSHPHTLTLAHAHTHTYAPPSPTPTHPRPHPHARWPRAPLRSLNGGAAPCSSSRRVC